MYIFLEIMIKYNFEYFEHMSMSLKSKTFFITARYIITMDRLNQFSSMVVDIHFIVVFHRPNYFSQAES